MNTDGAGHSPPWTFPSNCGTPTGDYLIWVIDTTGRISNTVTETVTRNPACPLNTVHFTFAFRRSAQYRFIRSETAFLAAADILERLRRRCFFAGLGSAFQGNGFSPLQAASLGNCRRIPAISAWSC